MSATEKPDFKSLVSSHYSLGVGVGLFAFAVVWAKLGVIFVFGESITLAPLVIAFAVLSAASPPMAAAFYYNSIYLLGNISIAYYPGISALSMVAVAVVIAVVARRISCSEMPDWKRLSFEWRIAFVSMTVFFAIGLLMAAASSNAEWLNFSGDSTFTSLFTDSMRSKNGWSHYALLSHWLVFLLLGFLAIRNRQDLKVFAACFSVSVIVLLAALPGEFFGTYISKVFVQCEPFGITSQNVNRSYVGYSAAAASVAAMVLAHQASDRAKIFWWSWWAISLLIILFAGSKGPVIAVLLATIYLAMKYRMWDGRPYRRRLIVLAAPALLMTVGMIGIFNPSVRTLLPCGLVEQYFGSTHSFVSRSEMITDAVQAYVRKPGHWLLGHGFGAATRSVDPNSGNLTVHAGSLNLVTDFFLEVGLLGTTSFLLSVGIVVFMIYRRCRFKDQHEKEFVQHLLSGLFIIVAIKAAIAADTHYEDLIPLVIGTAMACGVVFSDARAYDDGGMRRWARKAWFQVARPRAGAATDPSFERGMLKLLSVMRLRIK